MSKCEHHRVGQKHTTGLFIDWCRDDVWIHRQTPPTRPRLHFHLHGGVFSGEERAQILIEHENNFYLACMEERSTRKRNRKRVLLSGRRIWITTKRKKGAVERNEWRLKWFGLGGGEWVIRGWRNFNMEGNVTFISSALTHSVSSVWIFHVRLFQSY